MRYAIPLAVIALLLGGCELPENSIDVRELLLESAKKGDPGFPNGKEVLLTHFSHVGHLMTASGERIHVVDRRAVLAGMLAPGGQNYITFFDGRHQFLGKIHYIGSRPLWCDGSRLYLFGDLDGAPGELIGNVIDVSKGYSSLTAYHASAYGSSGGIED